MPCSKSLTMLTAGVVLLASCLDPLIIPTPAASRPPTVVVDSPDVPKGYSLVWHDEFDGTGHPDPGRWGYATALNYIGWGNNEQEFYTDHQLKNAHVADGLLHLVARVEPSSEVVYGQTYTYDYTSARLHTYGKASWTYGFLEVRAKVPGGAGTWPAIWTLGTGLRWPEDGETDLMEQWGTSTATGATFHVTGNAGSPQGTAWAFPPDLFTTFHTYQMLWTPTVKTLMVDGQVVNTYTKDTTLTGPASFAQWPFDQAEYLVLNLAVGGNGNQTVDQSLFPRDFQVDYVRVYQKP